MTNMVRYEELKGDPHEAALRLVGEGYAKVYVEDEGIADEIADAFATVGRKVAVIWEMSGTHMVVWA